MALQHIRAHRDVRQMPAQTPRPAPTPGGRTQAEGGVQGQNPRVQHSISEGKKGEIA